MATYSITAPDGKTYSVDGPPGASKEDVIAAVMHYHPMSVYTTKELENAPSAPSSLSDIGKENLAAGLAGAGTLANLFGVRGTVADYLREKQQELSGSLSPLRKEEMAIQQELEKRAEGQGAMKEIGTSLRGIAKAPLTSVSSAITSGLPLIASTVLAPEAVAPELVAGGVGALMGLGGQKEQNYATVKQAALDAGESEAEAEKKGQAAAEYSAKNLPGLGVATATGALEGAAGAAGRIGKFLRPAERTGIETLTAPKNIPEPTMGKAFLKSVGESALTEGIQGGGGQIAANMALQNAGFDTPLMSGVYGATGHDALLGALTGTAVTPLELSNMKREYEIDKLKQKQEEEKQKAESLQKQKEQFNQQMGINPETLMLPAPAEQVEGNKAQQSLQNPLGHFTKEELGPERVAAIDAHRAANGKPALDTYSIEDVVDAMPSQSRDPNDTRPKNPEAERAALNELVANKAGHQNEQFKPKDVLNKAIEKGVDTSTEGFKDFLRRTTGIGELGMMTDGQLFAAHQALENMEPHTGEGKLILPRGTNATHYSQGQYFDAINALDANPGQPNGLNIVKEATGLKRDEDAAHLISDLVRNGDFDLNEKNELTPPSTSSYLPAGFHIEEGTFKEGEAPEHFKIMAADKELGTADTQEAAEEKMQQYAEIRAKDSESIDKQIADKEQAVKDSEFELQKMEARGEGRSLEYQKASANHAALVAKTEKEIGDLNRLKDSLNPELHPLSVKAGNIVPTTRKGFTIFRNNQAIGTFPSRSAAEKHIAANLSTKELEQLTGDKRRRSFARLADQELSDRASTGIKVRVTSAFKQAADRVGKDLEAALAKFGLKGVGLKLVQSLQGAEGSYFQHLVTIALDTDNPMGVLRHEAIHALKDLGFFSENQWNALRRMAKDKWIKQFLKDVPYAEGKSRYDAYMEKYNGDMAAVEEEAIADAFRHFNEAGTPPGMIAAIMKRLNDFMEAVKNAFAGNGFTTADDVFRKVEAGELKPEAKVEPTGKKFSFKKYNETVPKEPGTEPIKEGHVRLYHQTDGDNLRQIEKEGLLLEHAKGIEGPRAIYAGETPFYGEASSRPTLEFQVPKKDWDSPFVLRDVKPEDFIAAHYPWHRHARYLEDKEGIENVLAGKFDDLDPKSDTGKAVQYIKDKYGKEKLSLKGPIGLTDERINRLINTYIYTQSDAEKKTKAYIAYVSPKDFLNATATKENREQLEAENKPLDLDKLTKEGQPIYLSVKPVEGKEHELQITGHEGRHRMMALRDAGIERVPVIFEFSSGENRNPIDASYIHAQKFYDNKRGVSGFKAEDLTPINYENRNEVKQKFGQGETRFSLKAPDTPEFKRWFGNSKIVNKDGTPKVMYHGTARDITEFKPKQANAIFVTDNPNFAAGFSDASADYIRKEILNNMPKEKLEKYVDRAIKKAYKDGAINQFSVKKLKERPAHFAIDNGIVLDYMRDDIEKEMPSNQNIMPVFVKADNPFDYQNPTHIKKVLSHLTYPEDWRESLKDGEWSSIEADDVQEAIQLAGFDGFYVEEGGHKNLAVYEPEQIKSATGNVGTFEATNPDIRMSLRSQIDTLPNGSKINQRIDETTMPRENKSYISRMLGAFMPANFTSFRQEFLNRYEAMAQLDKRVAKYRGVFNLMADQSAETQALFSELASGIASQAVGMGGKGGVPVFKNGHTTVDHSKKGVLEVFAPLLEKTGDARIFQAYQFWAGVKRGSRFMADGKEHLFTKDDIKLAAELEQQHPEFKQVQKDWIEYNNAIVKYLMDSNVLSAAQAKEFTKYSDYVPFFRQLDGEATVGPQLFSALANVKQPRKLKGGEAPLADFLETIVRNTQASIQAGMKNHAALQTVKNAEEIKEAQKVPFGKKGDPLNTVTVLEKGNKVDYEVKDAMLFKAMQSLNLPQIPGLAIAAAPANMLRNLVTKMPDFMLANMIKDSMQAWIISGKNMMPIAETVAQFGKGLASQNSTIQTLINAGLAGGHDFAANIEATGKNLEYKLKEKTGKLSGAQKAFKPFKSVWQGLEHATEASDLATRAAIYEKTLAETGNEAEALKQALEVMNFYRKGANPLIRILTAVTPFLNARMQGIDVFYRAGIAPFLDENATQAQRDIQKTFFIRGASVVAMSCAYWLLVHNDDDYKKQEQETKDNNFLIPSLGIKIPVANEVGLLFKTIPERIMAYTLGDDTGQDLAESMARGITSMLAVQPPQVILPLLENEVNYSFFTGRALIPPGMENIEPEFQTTPSTSKTAQIMGQALGYSPIKIDHAIQGYTGALGTYVTMLIDASLAGQDNAPQAALRFEQMPFIKRFALDPEARGTVTAYYKLKDEVDKAVRTQNLLEATKDYENYGEYTTEHAKILASKDFINTLDKRMQEMNKQAKLIRASSLDPETKRDLLKTIADTQNALTANIQTIRKMLAE